jgi:hypothetical protein
MDLPNSRQLAIVEENRGDDGPQRAVTAVISSPADLQKFLSTANLPAAIPDLTRNTHVAIALGERRTAGFRISVLGALQFTQGIAAGLVTFSYSEVAPNGLAPDVLTKPWALFRIDDLGWFTTIVFNMVSAQFIVIQSVTGGPYQVAPSGSVILATMRRVFGPATRAACEDWIKNHPLAYGASAT